VSSLIECLVPTILSYLHGSATHQGAATFHTLPPEAAHRALVSASSAALCDRYRLANVTVNTRMGSLTKCSRCRFTRVQRLQGRHGAADAWEPCHQNRLYPGALCLTLKTCRRHWRTQRLRKVSRFTLQSLRTAIVAHRDTLCC